MLSHLCNLLSLDTGTLLSCPWAIHLVGIYVPTACEFVMFSAILLSLALITSLSSFSVLVSMAYHDWSPVSNVDMEEANYVNTVHLTG